MPIKRTSNVPRNNFKYDEAEVCGFTSETSLSGDYISSFSFYGDSDTIQTNSKCKSNDVMLFTSF
ncbi:hypothetical protein [Clostridium beijerinckii]|uniref:hypothetical protein n=1 Tax=Clostridium beijerinckii TaxID=1520 RepID=UPI00047E48E5|nr:hypothetical protein [Clostridium beijerinckii]